MKYITTMLLIVIISCTNSQNNNQIPEGAKKRIITAYYEPLLNNGEWVCGKELQNYSEGQYPDTTYYDSYNNVLLLLNRFDRIENIYYSPEENKLSKQNITSSFGIDKHKGKVEFIRNNSGILIERKVSGDVYALKRDLVAEGNHIYKYNNEGDRIADIEGGREQIIFKKLPSKGGQDIKHYQIIQDDNQSYYDNTKGLVEQGTEIYDSKSHLLQRRVKEQYEYGYVRNVVDCIYGYDNKGKKTEEISNEKYVQISIPGDLWDKKKELEEYVVENCYKNPEYELRTISQKWQYDSRGNNTYFSISWQSSWQKNGYINNQHNRNSEYKYEYKYNTNGDWVECTTYENIFDFLRQIYESKPTLITMRQIEYY